MYADTSVRDRARERQRGAGAIGVCEAYSAPERVGQCWYAREGFTKALAQRARALVGRASPW